MNTGAAGNSFVWLETRNKRASFSLRACAVLESMQQYEMPSRPYGVNFPKKA